MRFYIDCVPCVLRQVLEASRMATDDVDLQEKIMDDAIREVRNFKKYDNSPEACRRLHALVTRHTGVEDPYLAVKREGIATALRLLPSIRAFWETQQDRPYWALKIAATGNVMDAAIYKSAEWEKIIKAELEKEFAVCDLQEWTSRLQNAKSLLIVGDNAGETVFDRLLVESLSGHEITYAVRSKPALNDATVQDAHASGLNGCCRVMPSGSKAPGTILKECSREFLDVFYGADIVLSKGQGNFETLSDAPRDLFFLLKVKCPLVSRLVGAGLNEYVFKYSRPEA